MQDIYLCSRACVEYPEGEPHSSQLCTYYVTLNVLSLERCRLSRLGRGHGDGGETLLLMTPV